MAMRAVEAAAMERKVAAPEKEAVATERSVGTTKREAEATEREAAATELMTALEAEALAIMTARHALCYPHFRVLPVVAV